MQPNENEQKFVQNTLTPQCHQVTTPKVSANDYKMREGEYFNPVKDMNVQVKSIYKR